MTAHGWYSFYNENMLFGTNGWDKPQEARWQPILREANGLEHDLNIYFTSEQDCDEFIDGALIVATMRMPSFYVQPSTGSVQKAEAP